MTLAAEILINYDLNSKNSYKSHKEKLEKCSLVWYSCPMLSSRTQAFPFIHPVIPSMLAFFLTFVILWSQNGCQRTKQGIFTLQHSVQEEREGMAKKDFITCLSFLKQHSLSQKSPNCLLLPF